MEAPGIEPATPTPQLKNHTPVTASPPETLPYSLPCKTQIDPDLSRLIDAWPTLPEALRVGILAMIAAAKPGK